MPPNLIVKYQILAAQNVLEEKAIKEYHDKWGFLLDFDKRIRTSSQSERERKEKAETAAAARTGAGKERRRRRHEKRVSKSRQPKERKLGT
ncbi:unnamed protein product [Brassicogethes aeneus]|uniref:Uncharacterized protein n=1 Tax=Brassicogethes aeneus TaxID=1431903 RepID=A0A9P0FCI1_BRAAE|nr:unnamed protein product [Brassicogethes aeneus]